MVELYIALGAAALAFGTLVFTVISPSRNDSTIIALQKELAVLQRKQEDLSFKYQTVITETLRLTGENIWLKNLLVKAGIDIPPLPEHLRPHLDEQGNITLIINRDAASGFAVSGNLNRQDISGGTIGQALSGEGEQKQ